MENAMSHYEKELASIRTSRASTSMLDNILVDAYNSKTNRPKFSVLDCSRIFSELNISPSDWLSGIKSSLNRL